jgi:predicted proteasome-type protease
VKIPHDLGNHMARRFLPRISDKDHHGEKRKAPMTIAIGILCRNPARVVIAADSQWTDCHDGSTSFCEKTSIIKFGCSDVIVARAGNPVIAERVLEKVENQTKSTAITDAAVVRGIFENAVRSLLSELDAHQQESLKETQNLTFLMYGFTVGDEPHLYSIQVGGYGVGLSKKPDPGHHFLAIGCPEVAKYLLSQWSEPTHKDDMAITVAIAIIQNVKRYQSGACGGETSVLLVGPVSSVCKSLQMPQKTINLSEPVIDGHFAQANQEVLIKCKTDLEKISAEMWQEYVRQLNVSGGLPEEMTIRLPNSGKIY